MTEFSTVETGVMQRIFAVAKKLTVVTVLIGILVGAAAAFVIHHPKRAQQACLSDNCG